jgi:hypothetical protein
MGLETIPCDEAPFASDYGQIRVSLLQIST